MSPVPVPARSPAAVAARPQRLIPGPAPGRQRSTAPRPRLRLVDNRQLEQAARRRRGRRLVIAAAAFAAASLLALAATNAVLVSNQVRLDALEQEVAEASARYQDLRLQVAMLEAPGRVISAAAELGMVPPKSVTHLPPGPRADTDPAVPAGGETEAAAPSLLAWEELKPYLGGQ